MERLATVSRTQVSWLAVLGLVGGVLALGTWSRSAESANDARAVRQLATTRIESDSGTQIIHEDKWTLTDEAGEPVMFVGWYSDEQGNLIQIQMQDKDSEQVWWEDYAGTPNEPYTCVETGPPPPTGLKVTLSGRLTEEQALVEGYVITVDPAPRIASTPPYVQVNAEPVAVANYEGESTTTWSATKDLGDGDMFRRIMALASDGLVAGFWSTAHDASGAQTHANSFTISRIETYQPEVFTQVMKEVSVDAASCN